MTTGDRNDVASRVSQLLPAKWFPDPVNAPVLNSVIQIYAKPGSDVFNLIQYGELQTRIATATDGWLDMIAEDYFGGRIVRSANQSDTSFSARIKSEILRERNTRQAVINILKELTGRVPIVFEPWRPADCFCLGQPMAGALGQRQLGSKALPGQSFIIAYEAPSVNNGLAGVAGLGTPYAGLRGGYMAMPDPGLAGLALQDADLISAVESVRSAGTILWIKLLGSTA